MRTLATLLLVLLICALAFAQPMSVLWEREGLSDSSHYAGIMPLGDQNQDGDADFLVWGYGNMVHHEAHDGYVEFFHGGNPPDTVPYWTKQVNPQTDWNLTDVETNADLNGDGYKDFMLCFQEADDYTIVRNEIYYGGPQADTLPDLVFHTDWQKYPRFMGDFNGDGADELYFRNYTAYFSVIYFGGSAMDSLPDWIAHDPSEALGLYGARGFGDVNGDGLTDILTGTLAGLPAIHVFFGRSQPDTVPSYSVSGLTLGDFTLLRDVNGDQRDELVTSTDSLVNIHFGRDTLRAESDATVAFSCPPLVCRTLGDVNGDGYNDFYTWYDYCGWEGKASLYLGHPWLYRYPLFSITGWQAPLNLPGVTVVTGLGDVNGDGVDDFGVGGISSNYDGQRGKCVVVAGNRGWVAEVEDDFVPQPSSFSLSSFPNPFNSTTRLSFTLPHASRVTLNIYDLTGRLVTTLADERFTSGEHQVLFDGKGCASGIYFARLKSDGAMRIQKMVLVR